MAVLDDEQAGSAAHDEAASGGSGGGTGAGGRPGWLGTAEVVAELDAQTFLTTGEDPFFAIQDAARTVGPGQAFVVRAPFAPVPLYGVLARKGFAHHAEEIAPDQWVITFFRERAVSAELEADDTHPHGATRP